MERIFSYTGKEFPVSAKFSRPDKNPDSAVAEDSAAVRARVEKARHIL